MLLPPNITQEERNIVEAIDYPIDPSIMRGFKFEPPDPFLAYLIWEYGLGELLRWLPDPRRAIREGVQWQRIRGTPKSLKIALSWANLHDIFIEEEVPGEHFAEFQVGAGRDVPNDLFIDAVIELAKLSAPIRTRLTRMYNDRYDIRRFILDSSDWGDLLSDYSGRRLTPDGPVLSFGRYNGFYTSAPDWILRNMHDHESHINAIILDTYRLDNAILSESDWHVLNHKVGFGRIYSVWNDMGIVLGLPGMKPEPKFAKAQIVLSDSWVLGDINACFPVNQTEETGQAPTLDDSALSEEYWNLRYVPLNERFKSDYSFDRALYGDELDFNNVRQIDHISRYDENIRWPELSGDRYAALSPIPRIDKEAFAAAAYGFMNDWHDFQHLDRPWTDTSHHVGQSLDRWLFGLSEAFTGQIVHKGAGLSEYILSALRESTSYQNDPILGRDLFNEAEYGRGDGWHDFSHLNRPWSDDGNVIFNTLERLRAASHEVFTGQFAHEPTGLSEISVLSPDGAEINQRDPIILRSQIGSSEYHGADTWHDFRHLDKVWIDEESIIAPVLNRARAATSEYFDDIETSHSTGLSEFMLAALNGDTDVREDPLMLRDRLGESEYRGVDGWHDHKHQDKSWVGSENIISPTLDILRGFASDALDGQEIHKGAGLSEYLLAASRGDSAYQSDPLMERGQIGESQYSGADGWHNYKHLNRAWSDPDSIVDWISDRHMLNNSPPPLGGQSVYDAMNESNRHSSVMSNIADPDTPTGERKLLGNQTAYAFMEGWHGYQHLNTSWDATPAHIETVHSQVMQ